MLNRLLAASSLMGTGAAVWTYGDKLCFHVDFLCNFNTWIHYIGMGVMILGFILVILAPIRSALGR
jgi:hypothetical protein